MYLEGLAGFPERLEVLCEGKGEGHKDDQGRSRPPSGGVGRTWCRGRGRGRIQTSVLGRLNWIGFGY